jgi:hypothetical protein
MPKHTVQTFFKDGTYIITGSGIPSCTYPDGSIFDGVVKISSTFQCNDTEQPFLQKNIIRQTTSSIKTTRLSLFSFNINKNFMNMNNLGQSIKGTYNIRGNKLYIDDAYGYNQALGTHTKYKIIFKLTPNGFSQQWYYVDNCENKYKLFVIQNYTYNGPNESQ